MTLRYVCAGLALLLAAGCGDTAPDDAPAAVSAADTVAGAGARAATGTAGDAVGYRRERSIDFTGDGRSETVIVTATGPTLDSAEVALTIEGARGDTLWHDTWPTQLYFKYDAAEGKADTTVTRIIQNHLDELLADDRITMTGGLPPSLRQAGDRDAVMREALRYHLAELDYRHRFDLTPADSMPPQAYSAIDAADISNERVNVVLSELDGKPSLMYYAGGEATYVIAWSEREGSFVRIYSCC
ncbi:MAG TPA: hypothetical protein VK912_07915 [Longimicrobiales bacterium]|nr:hypothetical protein [Longimicrobiales bacterium]